MKKIYFVRHGESEANASGILIGPEAKLTERGCEQSRFLAKRFETIAIDKIIASPYVRTKETAEIFNETLGKPIEYSDLVAEFKHPSEEYGLHVDDPKRIAIQKQYLNRKDKGKNWKYSDEENFTDLKKRATAALNYLASEQDNRIAVISHGGIIRMMFSVMLQGEKLSIPEFESIMRLLRPNNTGITVCTYEDRWRVVTWNDHAHLGEVRL